MSRTFVIVSAHDRAGVALAVSTVSAPPDMCVISPSETARLAHLTDDIESSLRIA